MQIKLNISPRGIDAPAAIVATIRRRAAKLDRFADEVDSCQVTIDPSPHSGHKSEMYVVRVQLGWRNGAAGDAAAPHAERDHVDLMLAIHHAFDDVLDQLRRRESARRHGSRAHTEGGHEAPEKFNV